MRTLFKLCSLSFLFISIISCEPEPLPEQSEPSIIKVKTLATGEEELPPDDAKD